MPAVLISIAGVLGPMVPAPLTAAGAAPSAVSANPITAYVVNTGSGTVIAIATSANTAHPPITVGSDPTAIADHAGRDDRLHRQHRLRHGDPIATATNTVGPPITVEDGPGSS